MKFWGVVREIWRGGGISNGGNVQTEMSKEVQQGSTALRSHESDSNEEELRTIMFERKWRRGKREDREQVGRGTRDIKIEHHHHDDRRR
jgi:hypothetical protein